MMKKLAIVSIAATLMAFAVSLPRASAQGTVNPAGALKTDPFADVPTDHWAYNAVEFLRQNGLAEGYPDKTFRGKRPMTRYEFAQIVSRMVQGLVARIQAAQAAAQAAQNAANTNTTAIKDLQARMAKAEEAIANRGIGGGVSPEEMNAAIKKLQDQIVDRATIEQMIRDAVSKIQPVNTANFVTTEQFQTLQNLVNEFSNELKRMGVEVDALRKGLKDLQGRVEAIEAELARRPRIFGNFNIIGKTSWLSSQMLSPVGAFPRPAFDRDLRPLKPTTNVLQAGTAVGVPGSPATVLPYYDTDLFVLAHPTSDVQVGVAFNLGNYLSSYPGHGYNAAGPDAVTPYKMWMNVPFNFLGSTALTLGRRGTQLTPYTFKAVDPDSYTFLPREDSGEIVSWGGDTTFHFGSAKLKAGVGVDPLDGRLLPLNVYPVFQGLVGGTPTFANTTVFGGGSRIGSAPIAAISNWATVRLAFGEPDYPQYRPSELPVGTAAQYNYTPTTVTREVAAEAANPAPPAPGAAPAPAPSAAEVPAETGFTFGPFRNMALGLNWLTGAGRQPVAVEDARANVYSADARFGIGPVRFEGEAAFGQSDTGGVARPRALDDSAIDLRGFWGFGLGNIGDLEIGGGWRRITLDYVVPGYWGQMGSWKDPRNITGPLAEIRLPFRWKPASFLGNMTLKASGEWYRSAQNITTIGAVAANDPNEKNLHIDRYLAGLSFGLTSRDTVDLGVEQVFRDYVASRAGDLPLSLPTMGIGGSPLVGSRIKNTETYINFGVGHNFTPDIQAKVLYQLVDFSKFAVDRSNMPASYRGYVLTGQVGVRF